jgi:hypothetical protein
LNWFRIGTKATFQFGGVKPSGSDTGSQSAMNHSSQIVNRVLTFNILCHCKTWMSHSVLHSLQIEEEKEEKK